MKRKVLLFLYGPLSNSGVPQVLLSIVKSLNKSVDFTLLVLNGGVLDEEFKKYGTQIFYMQEKRPTAKWRRRIYDYTQRYQSIAKQLNNFLKTNKFDAIHCCGGFDGGLYMKVAFKNKVPIRILHCHGQFPKRAHNHFKELQKNRYRKYIENFTTIKLTCSKKAGETYFLNTDNMITLVNSVDIESYLDIAKTVSNKIRILQIGVYNENKNQLFSLELLKDLIKDGKEAKLTFIGYDLSSNYGKKLQSYTKENDLNGHVKFLPSNSDKKEVFKETDVLLLPSYTEACPLVALEAQAANIPVLASSNVPSDVDFGLCEYISLANKEKWINSISNIKNEKFILREEFYNQNHKGYGEKMYKLYCGEMSDE